MPNEVISFDSGQTKLIESDVIYLKVMNEEHCS